MQMPEPREYVSGMAHIISLIADCKVTSGKNAFKRATALTTITTSKKGGDINLRNREVLVPETAVSNAILK